MACARRRIAAFTLVSIALILLGTIRAPAQISSTDSTILDQLTQSLVKLSSQPAIAQSSATSVAKQRQDLLLKLAAESADKVWKFILTADVVSKLPPSAQRFVEKDADDTGTVQVVFEDYADHHKLRFFLENTRGRTEVLFSGGPPKQMVTGSVIRAIGKRLGDVLLVQSGSATTSPSIDAGASSVQLLSLASPNTFGPQSTAVFLVNFLNNTLQPFSISQIHDAVFSDVSNFDKDNSQNQTWLTGEVFGWFTLPITVTACPYSLPTMGQQLAAEANIDLTLYDRVVYIFPQTNCGWLGAATVGGTPSWALINGTAEVRVIAHEMGHNLGLYHSHAFDCQGAVLAATCYSIEYGDLFDTMGDATGSQFNAFQKERLGWLNYGSSLPIQTVTTSGRYSLAPYESSAGTKALKILQTTDPTSGIATWYYIEYRQPIGFDTGLTAYPTSTAGVLIHTGTDDDGNSSYLLNMTPADSSFSNAALGVGQTFTDEMHGITIQTVTANASGASVDISLGAPGCHWVNPSVAVTPAQASPASAGTTAQFTISVSNNDSSLCYASEFLLQIVTPAAGWAATASVPSLTLAGGTTGSATMLITSPAGTPAGSYPIVVYAFRWPQYTYASSFEATYVVAPGPVADFAITAPTNVSTSPGSSVSAMVTTTVSNGFSAQLSFFATNLPAGVTASFSPATLASPGSGTSTLTLNCSSAAIAGTYLISITASGGGVTHITSLNLTITPSPPPPPPKGRYSLFPTTATPSVANMNAGIALEVGMKFRTDMNGFVTAVRFYKGPSNVGTHVGSLWNTAGQLLAQGTFTGETASGWQQVDFASPVPVVANSIYVVSYHSSGYYSYDLGYFTSPLDNSPLHAIANATSVNGVYAYGPTSTFPVSGAGASNFWVDVVFTTTPSTASLVSIAVLPANPSRPAGSTVQLQAIGTYSDNTTRDITGQVNWTSATMSVASVNAAGLVTTSTPGVSVITATFGNVSSSTTLTVTAAPPPPPPTSTYTLFANTNLPAVANANAGVPLELGMKFTADHDGLVTGVRFYKGASNQGTHVGSLWSSTGQLLAQTTFVGEADSGWQQASFATSVPITANTVYVISYHSSGYYSYDSGYFNYPVDHSPLHAVFNGTSMNGVYSYNASSTFPVFGAAGSNFWVDVIFSPK